MEIQRINSYDDARFAKNVLYQHGGFLIDGKPCEVEIVSDFEAIVRGENPHAYQKAIEEFRFYAPHITTFYDSHKSILLALPQMERLTVSLDNIQPSQFFVDEEKIAAIRTFITNRRISSCNCFPITGDTFLWTDTQGFIMP